MNTRLKFKRRIVFTVGILLLALWIPLTAFSQQVDRSENTEHLTKSIDNTGAHYEFQQAAGEASCPHKHQFHEPSGIEEAVNWVGFGEVDPAAQLMEEVAANLSSRKFIVDRTFIGFAEADPADVDTLNALTSLHAVERSAWQNPVGFAEQELFETNEAVDSTPTEVVVTCQHTGDSNSIPAANELSGLPGREDPS